MRVIPVLDLRRGMAVHARAGERHRYRALESPLVSGGNAFGAVRAYRVELGLEELYVADLDALAGGEAQYALVQAIADPGVTLWLDAGITNAESARAAIEHGAGRVVVALETLPGLGRLAEISAAVGAERAVFSLDLRDGVPVTAPGAALPASVAELAQEVVRLGVGTLVVLDVARVGSGRGVDTEQLRALRRACPDVTLVGGGGVRGNADLDAMADAGCDAALVATALHDGRLDRDTLRTYRGAGVRRVSDR